MIVFFLEKASSYYKGNFTDRFVISKKREEVILNVFIFKWRLKFHKQSFGHVSCSYSAGALE